MAQNEPQRQETPPGPSPNSPSLLFEYQCRSGNFIRLANRIESKKSIRQRESNRIESKLFCPNWNDLQYTSGARNDAKTRADADYNFLIDYSSKINFDYSINFEQFLQSVRTTMKTAKFKYLLSYLCEWCSPSALISGFQSITQTKKRWVVYFTL